MQPDYELTFHPVDLRIHGLNPHGKTLYRVVWADTRKCKVWCGGKMHVLDRYLHGDEASAKGHWVLEKWAPPEVLIGLTREQYETMLAAMPGAAAEEYPTQGDWELSRIFNEDSGPFCKNIDEGLLHKQLAMHEFRHRTLNKADRERELIAAEETKEVVAEKKFDELFETAREEISCQQ